MLPVFTIIGRPNVGKSTLFNYLTGTRDALVADMPGLTRDRQYGDGKIDDRKFIVVDTGGLMEPDDPEMTVLTDKQVYQAIEEADKLLFVVDAKSGFTTLDAEIAKLLRREHFDKVVLLVNKSDRDASEVVCGDFFQLGLGDPIAISAAQGRGIRDTMRTLLSEFPIEEELNEEETGIRIAVIGRPNVGKSTLINRIIGEDRLVVMDRPGTTRDSVAVPFSHKDQRYTLIDTAGIRRRSKVSEVVEKFSIIKAMQAMEQAHVVLFVLDATDKITDQDLRLLGHVCEKGKALVIVFNKWDDMDSEEKEQFKVNIDRRLMFVDFARRYFISALHGSGVGKLYHAINEAYDSLSREITTSQLTKHLDKALHEHQPPVINGRRIKVRLAHIGGRNPMVIILHGKQLPALPQSYQRYLVKYFRKAFDLVGIPIILKLRNDDNPYV